MEDDYWTLDFIQTYPAGSAQHATRWLPPGCKTDPWRPPWQKEEFHKKTASPNREWETHLFTGGEITVALFKNRNLSSVQKKKLKQTLSHVSITSSIPVGNVWKFPDVSQANSIANQRQNIFCSVGPMVALRCITLDFPRQVILKS